MAKKKKDVERAMPGREEPVLPKRKSIQSVESGIKLLLALADSPTSLALRQVAMVCGLSRSQTHRYLLSYVNTGLVRQDPASGHYELGLVALRIGLAALRRSEPVSIATEELSHLVDEVGFSGQVAVWGDHGPTIVRIIQGRRPVVTSIHVGSTVPVLTSSMGQVCVAYLPRSIATAAAKAEWRRSNPDDPNGWRAVVANFEHTIREAGYSAVSDTMIPGLSAASSPVLNSDGDLAAVLCLMSHASDRLLEHPNVLTALRDSSKKASARLGYQPQVDLGER